MLLRRERTTDRDAVLGVHSAAFGPGSESGDGAPPLEARLVDELTADGDVLPGLSIVAERAGTIVGHVVCSRGVLSGGTVPGLGPIGVLPTAWNTGVGSALMHAVLAAADVLGHPAVLLLGDPEFYRRFGFVPASDAGVWAPDPAWGEHFQIRTLTTWSRTYAGAFSYAPAFGRLA